MRKQEVSVAPGTERHELDFRFLGSGRAADDLTTANNWKYFSFILPLHCLRLHSRINSFSRLTSLVTTCITKHCEKLDLPI